MAGEILGDNEERLDKPGTKIPVDTDLHLKGKPMPYVSRGGLKLEKALKVFHLDVKGLTVLDIGSSTGGFTDVMLQSGAKMSYALDVGSNQLVWKLREVSSSGRHGTRPILDIVNWLTLPKANQNLLQLTCRLFHWNSFFRH